jgi:hypothetical protein
MTYHLRPLLCALSRKRGQHICAGNNLRGDIPPWVMQNLNVPFLQHTDALGKGGMTGQGRLEEGATTIGMSSPRYSHRVLVARVSPMPKAHQLNALTVSGTTAIAEGFGPHNECALSMGINSRELRTLVFANSAGGRVMPHRPWEPAAVGVAPRTLSANVS